MRFMVFEMDVNSAGFPNSCAIYIEIACIMDACIMHAFRTSDACSDVLKVALQGESSIIDIFMLKACKTQCSISDGVLKMFRTNSSELN